MTVPPAILAGLQKVVEGLKAYVTSLAASRQAANPGASITQTSPMPQPLPQAPKPVLQPSPGLLQSPWSDTVVAHHNVRAICDQEALSYDQKQVLAACVYQESEFHVNPKPNQNKDPKTGAVWSTDYGIVQINDHFHIGPGKDFPSVEYVIAHPAECVRWMARYYKTHGNLSAWSSYSTGAYKRWLGKV